MLQASLTAATLAAIGLPESMMPAALQSETLVPFTDIPTNINFTVDPNTPNRFIDIRTIDGQFTPKDKFFATQHHGQPEVDPTTFRLKVGGNVNKTMELTLDEIRKRPAVQLPAAFECSGNSRGRIQGMASAGLWTGTRLKDLLNAAGVKPEGKEVVFFGADHGDIDVPFRGQTYKVDQHFGRSLTIENGAVNLDASCRQTNGTRSSAENGDLIRHCTHLFASHRPIESNSHKMVEFPARISCVKNRMGILDEPSGARNLWGVRCATRNSFRFRRAAFADHL
jgi:DMSO/TMAO reductase YedYZ molybdopterin-dependent catalytic subunit